MCETKHKHYDVIVAWAAGKKIEYFSNIDYKWRDSSQPSWYEHYEYRIKPEPKPDIVNYIQATKDSIRTSGPHQCLGSNLKVIFDGETGKLKSVEMI